jgi:putative transposase
MDLDERADTFRFIVRDARFTHVFDTVFTAAGVEVLRTPHGRPKGVSNDRLWHRNGGALRVSRQVVCPGPER